MLGTGGEVFTKYDQYDLLRPGWIASIERLFADDRVRVLAGFGVSYARIRDYTGKQVDAIDAAGHDTEAPEATTRLELLKKRVSGSSCVLRALEADHSTRRPCQFGKRCRPVS